MLGSQAGGSPGPAVTPGLLQGARQAYAQLARSVWQERKHACIPPSQTIWPQMEQLAFALFNWEEPLAVLSSSCLSLTLAVSGSVASFAPACVHAESS